MNDIVALAMEFATMAVRARRAEEELTTLRKKVAEMEARPQPASEEQVN